MKNKEKFIKKWEKDRQKGKSKYILLTYIKFVLELGVAFTVITLVEGKAFIQVTEYLPGVIGGLIGYIPVSFRIWNKNEENYNFLINSDNSYKSS